VNFNYLVNDPNEPLWSVFFEGNFQKETKLTETGDYTLRIFAKDWAMNESNKIIHFKIVGPPQVIFTDPAKGASNVDVYKNITIAFNKEMDPSTVNSGTVQFSPALVGGFTPQWSGDGKTVTLTLNDPQQDLKFLTNYVVTITDGVKDKDGTPLDGDRDGKPGGNYEFSFTTRKPNIVFVMDPASFLHEVTYDPHYPPPDQYFTDYSSAILTNNEQRELTVNFTATGGELLITSLTLPPNTTISQIALKIVTLTSCYAEVTARVIIDNDTVFNDTEAVDVTIVSKNSQSDCGPPDRDHPDDNWQVNDPQYPTPWYYGTDCDVGILISGYCVGLGHLLGKFKIPTAIVGTNFRVLGTMNRTIDSLKVLIIPTGALYGKENNTQFKERIANFVQNGGTVICMTQQQGYEWTALPDPPTGYGWHQDQSCWCAAGYFSDWDVILSGQNKAIINAHIDGFFTDVPNNAKVIMKRRTSAIPELFYYDYGQGKVLVCGLYTDWGYGQAQWSDDEANLIRDIITWALDTKRPIPEYYAGNSMSLNIPIHYYPDGDTTPANKVKIKILNPNRDSLYVVDLPITPPLKPGDSTTVNLSCTAPNILGIYPIEYRLYKDAILLQKERLGERFAVKTDIPVGEHYLGNFGIWATAPTEHVLGGDTVGYNIFIRNSTTNPFSGKVMIGIHEQGGAWWQVIDSLFAEIPPDTFIILNYSRPIYKSTSTYFGLYCTNVQVYYSSFGNAIVRCEKGVWVDPPLLDLVVKTDSTEYSYGDTMFYQVKGISNFTAESCFLKLTIKDKNNRIHFASLDTLKIDSTHCFEINRALFISDTMPSGQYTLSAEVLVRNKSFAGSTYFQIRYPSLTVEVLPDTLITGFDTLKFVAYIKPAYVNLRDVKVLFSIMRSADSVLCDSVSFDTLHNLDTIHFVFAIPPEKKKEGAYNFNYRFLYLDRTIKGGYTLYNYISEKPNFDKYQYTVKDTVRYEVKLTNGRFLNSGYLVNFCPEAGFYDSIPLTLPPGSDTTFQYSITIPETLSAGYHYVYSKFITSAFMDSIASEFYIPLYIVCETDTGSYCIGDTIRIIFYNGGGAEVQLYLSNISLWDFNWNCFYHDSTQISVPPKDFAFYEFVVPEVMRGPYYLVINGNVEGYDIPINKRIGLWIDGISANVVLKTSKDIYLPYDSVKPQADCKNGDYQFNGRLDLSIRPYGLYPGDTAFIPGEDLWPIYEETSPGCALSNGRVKLLGWDKLYQRDLWTLEPTKGRGNKGISSERELILKILEAKRQGKGRGSEPIRYTAMAEYDKKLYASLSTDIRRKIVGPYPYWDETYDLSQIASISQFTMDRNYFYIVDADSEYVYKVVRGSGNIEKRWKVTSPGGIGLFNNALYVVDRINHLVLKTSLNGDTLLVFGADSLVEPKDLAIDNSGKIYVSDISRAKVYVFDNNGNCLGTKGTGKFSQIAIDKKGYLYGANMDSLKLVKYDENGNLLEYYGQYPDEIRVSDTLIHLSKIESGYYDYVFAEVLTNYGRNKGWTSTQPAWIPGIKYIINFLPTQTLNNGNIDWYFVLEMPENERPEKGKDIEEWVWYPIDSLRFVDLEGYDYTPIFKAELTVPDGVSPEIEKFNISYLTRRSGDIIWQDSVSLSFAPQETVLVESNAGVFSDSGEFILWGDAYLNNGQRLLLLNSHNFYVLSPMLGISLKTDRDVYYPGETIKAKVIVVNNSDSVYKDLNLELFKRDERIFDTLIASLAPTSACTLSVFLSDSSSFLLSGLLFRSGLDTLKQYKSVDVQIPNVGFWVAYPCSVSHRPFEVETEVSNFWSRDVEVVLRSACGDSAYLDAFVLLPGESRVLTHTFMITADETLTTEILKPTEYTEKYEIRFGERLEVKIDSVVASENSVLIPYSVVNIGEFDCAFNLHLTITDSIGTFYDSITYSNLLPIGDTLNGEWGVSLDYGQYHLNWTAKPESAGVILSQGSVSVNIIQPNQVGIDSIVLMPQCNSLGNLIFDIPVKNNSANTFYGNIGLYSSFINETKELEIGPLEDTVIRFISNAILNEGYQVMTARVLQNGMPIDEYGDSVHFESALLIEGVSKGAREFGILTFNAGDTAKICIKTKNLGTAIGEEDLRLEIGELGEETRLVSLIPGEIRCDTFVLFIPGDMDERTVYGSIWLGDEEYILPIHILGYKVFVSASLNQPNFQEGDTVILNLKIENQNERNIKGFGTANYNGENVTKDFYLSGYSQNIDYSNPEILKAIDTPGVYVSKVLWLDDWDSLMVRPEGQGNFGFWVRIVEQDSIHYSVWSSETCFAPSGAEQALLLQYKVEFSDTVTHLERINLRIYDSGGYRDTIIETFEPVDITQQFVFPFEPTANLMFYGVYNETGRGLWLNTIYVFNANDTCNIITDKQVYKMGDTVLATVQSPYSGRLIWSEDFYPMGTLSDSLWIDSLNNQFSFVLPQELTSGTYSIDFGFYIQGDTLQKFSSSQLFDVQGYQVVVQECRLDTNEYLPGDSIFIRFKLNSNASIPIITRIRFNQNYQWYDGLCDTVQIDSGFNIIDLATVVPQLERGPASLNYSFYKDSLFLTYSS